LGVVNKENQWTWNGPSGAKCNRGLEKALLGRDRGQDLWESDQGSTVQSRGVAVGSEDTGGLGRSCG
jgi:hypothetical protein